MKVARLPNGSPEIFHTLQGEGPSIGSPAVFLRLSLCNLHCRWCDTPYTWNWLQTPWSHDGATKYDQAQNTLELSPQALSNLLRQQAPVRLVITGGEPLLHDKELIILLENLNGHFPVIEIETNGTRPPSPSLAQLIDQFNVSPKLANSGNSLDSRRNPEALSWFAKSEKTDFKFVISLPDDLTEVLALCQEHHLPKNRIILMPEGRDSATLRERAKWLAPLCLQHGFRLGDRLHVHLWGDERAR